MVYKSYQYYCAACDKIIKGSMGVPSHRAGKKHKENVEKAKQLDKPYGIIRL